MAEAICHIVHLIFEKRIFLKQLKVTKVILILKKSDPTLVENYRPISILSFFSKIVEKLIEIRISNYFAIFNILSSPQFGFRAGLSTEHAVISFIDWIRTNLGRGSLAGSMFIDF